MRIVALLLIATITIVFANDGKELKRTQFSCHCNCAKNSKVLVSLMRSLLAQCMRKTGLPEKPLIPHGCQKAPKNCAEILNKCGGKRSGVYKVDPDGKGPFKVYCDQKTSGGGWTVFQKRKDGSVDFYRGWKEYKKGFGDFKGEFWLGLDNIHRLTHQARNRLRVDVEDTTGKTAYAQYDYFAVSSERSKYRLSLGSYSGTAGDSLSYHRNMAFTTKDSDNDKDGRNCATKYKGAWWYKGCHYSNLNGQYKFLGTVSSNGVNWYHWKNSYYSLKGAKMMIRPV